MRPLVIAFLFLYCGLFQGCSENKTSSTDAEVEGNCVYYWKTEFRLSSWEKTFLQDNDIKRIYLRFFDVDCGMDYDGMNKPIPIGSVTFKDTVPSSIDVVPVVFITKDALQHAYTNGIYNQELNLAQLIYERIKAMAKGNHIHAFREIQLDFDWAKSNRNDFFDFCKRMKSYMKEDNRKLSCTLRLHQLRGEMPPVDCATLMLYNTGSLYNPQTENSILDVNDVKPYLKGRIACVLPLTVAYPTYSWGILTRGDKLVRILHQSDYSDATLYQHIGEDKYCVLQEHKLDGLQLLKGDMIRLEKSKTETILEVKKQVLDHLMQKPRYNIVYHLDSANLKKYNKEEISNIFKN